MTHAVDELALREWLPRQRWFAAHGWEPEPRVVEELAVAGVRVLLVADEADPRRLVYQVPVIDGRDAARDPGFGPALLAAMGEPGYRTGRMLGVEQSNTSIVVSGPGRATAIVKLFRVVQHGRHPDAETARALSERRAPVPAFLGAIEAEWTAGGRRGRGHLAVAQEYVEGPGDAWGHALERLDRAESFAEDAAGLGRATAMLHVALADAFPMAPAGPDERRRIRAGWSDRLREAVALVRRLAEFEDAVAAVFAEVADDAWPALQRVHGDLHLGQVLVAAEPPRWRFTDFEGEPLRPVAERTVPDLALRDVAGMLRSFDYAAATHPAAPSTWARDCMLAFLDGYAAVRPDAFEPRGLLAALLLDKAVYEVRYEALHRPDWIEIPLGAVRRLTTARLVG